MAVKKETAQMQDDSKLFAFLAIFLSILGFIIALASKKENKYVMYYAKQSLVLFVVSTILYIIGTVITIITFGFGFFIFYLVWLLVLVLWIIGIIYSLSGEEKPLPVIGSFAEKINI